MRVLTCNVFGHQGGWAARRQVLVDGLRRLRPDVVALQEAIVTPSNDQAADILGADYYVHHQPGRSDDGSGASIASLHPIRNVHHLELDVSSRLNPAHRWIGSVAAAEIDMPSPIGPVLFVHHKASWQLPYERERELQAVRAAQFVESLVAERTIHVVVAGDFDATPHAASVRFWAGAQSLEGVSVGYRDAWAAAHGDAPGHTFAPENELVRAGEMPLELGRRIDYVFVRCEDHGPTLDVASCDLVFNEPSGGGVWASDHFGVLADLVAVEGDR